MNITWTFHTFEELTEEGYQRILALRREAVEKDGRLSFEAEDNSDAQAIHLTGYVNGVLAAYSRLLPRSGNGESLLSCIAVQPEYENPALSHDLVQRSVDGMSVLFEPKPIRAAAPERHRSLYEGLGFRQQGDGYLESGVPCVAMLRTQALH